MTNSSFHFQESGFAYERSKASSDSEQIEHTVARQHVRNSVSVEQIQDGIKGKWLIKTDRAITPRGPILHEINRFRQKEASAR